MLKVEVFSLGTYEDCDRVVAECTDGVAGWTTPDYSFDFDTVATGRTFRRAAAFALRQIADKLLANNPAFP